MGWHSHKLRYCTIWSALTASALVHQLYLSWIGRLCLGSHMFWSHPTWITATCSSWSCPRRPPGNYQLAQNVEAWAVLGTPSFAHVASLLRELRCCKSKIKLHLIAVNTESSESCRKTHTHRCRLPDAEWKRQLFDTENPHEISAFLEANLGDIARGHQAKGITEAINWTCPQQNVSLVVKLNGWRIRFHMANNTLVQAKKNSWESLELQGNQISQT